MANYEDEVRELFEFSLINIENTFKIIDIGVVNNVLAEKIKKATGLDLTDFTISIDNYALKHTIERHGNPSKEAKQGQVVVTITDILLIKTVIEEADNIFYDPRQKSPKATIVETFIFEKQIGDFYYVLKEIRRVKKKGKKNRLVFQTMYISKKRRNL